MYAKQDKFTPFDKEVTTLNIPNILTIIRLCLMPVFLSVYFSPIENARLWAMLVLIISFITDVLDGYIARRFNQITNLGKILDPVADKTMQITVLLCLALYNHALVWVVTFVFIKDALLGIGALLMHKLRGVTAQSNWFGKTACFVSLALSLVLIFPFGQPLSGTAVWVLGAVIVLFNAAALISYTTVFFKIMLKNTPYKKK